jgi:hypothetical protein
MNISKKQMMWILVAVAIFLIYWFYFRKKDTESGYKKNVPSGGNCFANKECSRGLVCRNGKCLPPTATIRPASTATTMPAPMPAPAPTGGSRPVTYSLGDPITTTLPTGSSLGTIETTTSTLSTAPTNTLTGTSAIDGTTML